MNFLKFLARRVREPSTMAAVSAFGVLFGVPPGTLDLAAQIIVGVTGMAAIFLPEGQREAP